MDKKQEVNNKRKHQRRELIYYLNVFDLNEDVFVGNLVDITPEGFLLVSENPINVNVSYHLRITIPDELDLDIQEIMVFAECKWCNTGVNLDLYEAGFRVNNGGSDFESLSLLMGHDVSFHGRS